MTPQEFRALASTPNKYHAKAVIVDGIRFHSIGEANRWFALRTLATNGVISDLRRQVRYPLAIRTEHGEFKRTYVADFVYRENGAEIVEDWKGFVTGDYKIKRDLMRVLHGITIRETGKGRAR